MKRIQSHKQPFLPLNGNSVELSGELETLRPFSTYVDARPATQVRGTMIHCLATRAVLADHDGGLLRVGDRAGHEARLKELKDLGTRLALRHNMLSPWTSFVAVEERGDAEEEAALAWAAPTLDSLIEAESVDALPYLEWADGNYTRPPPEDERDERLRVGSSWERERATWDSVRAVAAGNVTVVPTVGGGGDETHSPPDPSGLVGGDEVDEGGDSAGDDIGEAGEVRSRRRRRRHHHQELYNSRDATPDLDVETLSSLPLSSSSSGSATRADTLSDARTLLRQQQEVSIENVDLDSLLSHVSRLKTMSARIGAEIESQDVLLDDLDDLADLDDLDDLLDDLPSLPVKAADRSPPPPASSESLTDLIDGLLGNDATEAPAVHRSLDEADDDRRQSALRWHPDKAAADGAEPELMSRLQQTTVDVHGSSRARKSVSKQKRRMLDSGRVKADTAASPAEPVEAPAREVLRGRKKKSRPAPKPQSRKGARAPSAAPPPPKPSRAPLPTRPGSGPTTGGAFNLGLRASGSIMPMAPPAAAPLQSPFLASVSANAAPPPPPPSTAAAPQMQLGQAFGHPTFSVGNGRALPTSTFQAGPVMGGASAGGGLFGFAGPVPPANNTPQFFGGGEGGTGLGSLGGGAAGPGISGRFGFASGGGGGGFGGDGFGGGGFGGGGDGGGGGGGSGFGFGAATVPSGQAFARSSSVEAAGSNRSASKKGSIFAKFKAAAEDDVLLTISAPTNFVHNVHVGFSGETVCFRFCLF